MPASVEQALWAYLAAKYAATVDVTKLNSKRIRLIDVTTLGEDAGQGCVQSGQQQTKFVGGRSKRE